VPLTVALAPFSRAGQLLQLCLRLLQPEAHLYLAEHRTLRRDVLPPLLPLARTLREHAEPEVAASDERARPTPPPGLGPGIVRLGRKPRSREARLAMPFIPPMRATRLEDPRRLADPRYSAEPKLDG
jgi:hypothetical protein